MLSLKNSVILRHFAYFLSPCYLLCSAVSMFATNSTSAITVRHSQSISGQMKDGTNRMDDDSTDPEDGVQIELQQFIHTEHDVKIPTRKEARTARLQFLALCWSLFLMGWISGSTGPLLPSIQKSYDVSKPTFFSTFSVPTNYTGRVRNSLLDICFGKCG